MRKVCSTQRKTLYENQGEEARTAGTHFLEIYDMTKTTKTHLANSGTKA